jgi:hypothetical protein
LYQQYKDQVSFFIVYINEAHPSDLWQMQSNVKEGVLFADPTTEKDREKVANSCVRNLHIAVPALIDSIGNRVEQEYTGWPDRLYLIDEAGNVRFKTEAGPFGFDAKKLAAALRTLKPPAPAF